MSLRGKKILLGITGSIAAYKAAELIRLLRKDNAEVKVIMTTSASDFITPLTIATLAGTKVYHELFDPKTGEWENHVSLAMWADIFVIAPASANTIAKMANGICDNLLSAVYLASRCKVFVAPAMDVDMFNHTTTQRNLKIISTDGVGIWGPGSGELASGLKGKGRLLEPDDLFHKIGEALKKKVK